MTHGRLARRPVFPLLLLLSALLGASLPPSSAAAEGQTLWLGPADWTGAPPEVAGLRGPYERAVEPRALAEPAAFAEERMAGLARVDALLVEARTHAAALRDDAALSALAEAARVAEQLSDVAGAAAWNAEVQLLLGVTAAQAGLGELSTVAFRRAATLDPSRRLLPAEAPPSVVERYEAERAASVAAPSGELRVRADAWGARVFLDDVDRGPLPSHLRAVVGRHVLRIEAPGHRPYGAQLDVFEGERPELRVVLSPLPALSAARALERAVEARSYTGVPALLTQLQALGIRSALLVEPSMRTPGRGLLIVCDAQRCRGPVRWSAGEQVVAPRGTLTPQALTSERRWLERPSASAPTEAPALWKRWYVWVAASAAVAVAAVAAVAARPEPQRELRVVVDPGDLAP